LAGFRSKLLLAIATLWLGMLAASAARAQAQRQDVAAALTVDAGVTCLDSGQLVDHVASWLGTDRVSAPLTIEVHGSPYFARTVSFQIRRGDTILAERRFEPAPSRCADLHAAVGLAIALALKVSLLDSLIGTQRAGLGQTSRPYRILAHALGGVAVVPGLHLGLGLGLQRAVTERFAARLRIFGVFGPRGDFVRDQGRFRTWLGSGRLDLCSRLLEVERVGISVCLGLAAGGLYATGEAFPMSRHALISYVAVANALELDLELGARWSLALAFDVLVPLRRTSFVVRDQTGAVIAQHDLASAGVLIGLGPVYRF
jgi:hypothetical protein